MHDDHIACSNKVTKDLLALCNRREQEPWHSQWKGSHVPGGKQGPIESTERHDCLKLFFFVQLMNNLHNAWNHDLNGVIPSHSRNGVYIRPRSLQENFPADVTTDTFSKTYSYF
jgi:hypothetical protein